MIFLHLILGVFRTTQASTEPAATTPRSAVFVKEDVATTKSNSVSITSTSLRPPQNIATSPRSHPDSNTSPPPAVLVRQQTARPSHIIGAPVRVVTSTSVVTSKPYVSSSHEQLPELERPQRHNQGAKQSSSQVIRVSVTIRYKLFFLLI